MKTYPDFVVEDYSVEGVQKFCDDNGINLDITYQETKDKSPGSILSQSRLAGTKVVSGVNLRIVVAKEVTVIPPIVPDEKDDTTDSTNDKKEESTDSDKTVNE